MRIGAAIATAAFFQLAISNNYLEVAAAILFAFSILNLILAAVGKNRSALILWFTISALMTIQFIAALIGWVSIASVVIMPPLIIYFLLFFLFSRTLRKGRVPLITRIRKLHVESTSPKMDRYTRNLTLTWSILFGSILISSIFFSFSEDLTIWSIVNFYVAPAASIVLFVGEHLYRAVRYDSRESTSPLTTLKLLSQKDAWSSVLR